MSFVSFVSFVSFMSFIVSLSLGFIVCLTSSLTMSIHKNHHPATSGMPNRLFVCVVYNGLKNDFSVPCPNQVPSHGPIDNVMWPWDRRFNAQGEDLKASRRQHVTSLSIRGPGSEIGTVSVIKDIREFLEIRILIRKSKSHRSQPYTQPCAPTVRPVTFERRKLPIWQMSHSNQHEKKLSNSKWKYCGRPKIENRNGASEKNFFLYTFTQNHFPNKCLGVSSYPSKKLNGPVNDKYACLPPSQGFIEESSAPVELEGYLESKNQIKQDEIQFQRKMANNPVCPNAPGSISE
ncbi:unnamed protein product [Nesidiocoris tenuis]|uniref:Uncharacterized protein n=1 Tax=Nesidiocoris tenuis TaxID=355587 RepID=A0A6H5FZI4_9HEMI|nr:unnamed protein product [Nesidiocoris tenuis]